MVERGVRNGEGLAVAPGGTVWTAVNERDNIPYPTHGPYAGDSDAFGSQVIQAYVNNHPPDEVVLKPPRAVTLRLAVLRPGPGRQPSRRVARQHPARPQLGYQPGRDELDCAALKPVEVGLPAHSAPLGMTFLEGSKVPAQWSGGAVLAVHGSWDRQPPQAPAVLWLAWNAAKATLMPAATLVGRFETRTAASGAPIGRGAGPGRRAVRERRHRQSAIYRLASQAS